jgi:enterochelin esterase-like enzyme
MRRACASALAGVALLGPASPAALPVSWTVADHGARGGITYGGRAVDGVGAVYLPAGVPAGRRMRVAYVLAGGDGAQVARSLGIAGIGDQLSWQRTTPPFAVVVVAPHGRGGLARAVHYAQRTLPLTRATAGSAVIGLGAHAAAALQAVAQPGSHIGAGIAIGGRVPRGLVQRIERAFPLRRVRSYPAASPISPAGIPLWRHRLLDALVYAFTTPTADRALRMAAAVAPSGWTRIAVGPSGGTVWQGVIGNPADPAHPRASLVYLPPGVRRTGHYPALFLLHGLRGSPYSFVGGLRLAAVADHLISSRQVPPFIAVMPPAGSTPQFDGEWTGPWEDYVLQDVMPWADGHLPLATTAAARTLAGFSAGAYGSIDMALRHPGLFGTVESWSGYFRSPRDGSLANATQAERLAHDPQSLVRSEAPALRAARVRFFLSAGRREPVTLAATQAFASELASLGIAHAVHIGDGGHHGRAWRAVLPDGVRYALAPLVR